MHKSNVMRHLQSWKATFRAIIRNDTGCRPYSDADKRSLELALTLWISVCFDIVVRNSSLDAAAAGFANAKSALRKQGTLSYSTIMSQLADLDEILIRHGQISRADVRKACDAKWLRIVMYRFVGYPMREVHQACQFGKRLTLTSDPQLKETAESAYYANIDRIWKLDPSNFTNEEERIAQEWTRTFRNPTWSDIGWGNGQVAQDLKSTSQMRKAARHEAIPKTRYFERQIFKADDHWYFSRPRPVEYGPLEFHQGVNATGTAYDKVTNRIAKGALRFVPKSYKTYRSICMEDLSLVPYQQAMFKAMDRWFRTTLSDHIDLQDQARSRALAMLGSKHPELYATIDLSMASDSVSLALVRKWLWGTVLRDGLFATRSSMASTEKGDIELPMFAAMGSACCFPLECLVFALQVEATIRDIDGSEELGGLASWLVFGDDIIVETAYAPALIERLERNGFIVNKEKSYYTTDIPFREACGGEYYAGEDVTPVRLSRNFRDFEPLGLHLRDLDVRTLSSWYGLANALWQQGLWYARRFLLRELTERVPRGLLPWTNDESILEQESGARVVYRHVKRGLIEYDVPEKLRGFGQGIYASAIYTGAKVSYSCFDEDLQLAYNLVLGERVTQDMGYYSLRGHLCSAMQSIATQEQSWCGDVCGTTALIRQYSA